MPSPQQVRGASRAFYIFARARTAVRSMGQKRRAGSARVAAEDEVVEDAAYNILEQNAAAKDGGRFDWGVQARHIGSAALGYFPAITIFFGWPFAMKSVMQGRM